MRNIWVHNHNYFELELDVIWYTVTNNLPSLKAQINPILQENETQ